MGIKYVILGTSHSVQESDQFETVVIATINKYKISLIAEEYPCDNQSRLCGMAKRCHISYLQVDLFPNEWPEHGINSEMKARSNTDFLQNVDVRLSHADSVRENFWIDKITESGFKDGHVLIICGYLHLKFLVSNIQARGGTVVEKCTYPTSLLGRIPTKILSPDELTEYLQQSATNLNQNECP